MPGIENFQAGMARSATIFASEVFAPLDDDWQERLNAQLKRYGVQGSGGSDPNLDDLYGHIDQLREAAGKPDLVSWARTVIGEQAGIDPVENVSTALIARYQITDPSSQHFASPRAAEINDLSQLLVAVDLVHLESGERSEPPTTMIERRRQEHAGVELSELNREERTALTSAHEVSAYGRLPARTYLDAPYDYSDNAQRARLTDSSGEPASPDLEGNEVYRDIATAFRETNQVVQSNGYLAIDPPVMLGHGPIPYVDTIAKILGGSDIDVDHCLDVTRRMLKGSTAIGQKLYEGRVEDQELVAEVHRVDAEVKAEREHHEPEPEPEHDHPE